MHCNLYERRKQQKRMKPGHNLESVLFRVACERLYGTIYTRRFSSGTVGGRKPQSSTSSFMFTWKENSHEDRSRQVVNILLSSGLDWTYFEASELTARYYRRINEGKT